MILNKRVCTLFSCAIIALLQSCAKEELELNNSNQLGEPVNITATATLPQASNAQKTSINNLNGKISWVADDSININGTILRNPEINTSDATKATFMGTASPIGSSSPFSFWAIYPTSIAAGSYLAASTSVTLPTTRIYSNSDALNNANPMVAFTQNTNTNQGVTLNFKNLCSIIKIPVKAKNGNSGNAIKLNRIEIYSDTNISGTATVSWNSGSPTMAFTNGSKKLTLNCSNKELTSTADTFYILLASGSHNLTIRLFDANDKYMQSTSAINVNLNRNTIYKTEAIELNATRQLGVFHVSEGSSIIFAPGNLQWSANNGGSTATTHATADGTAAGTWRFAEHQYDYVGNNNTGSGNGNVYFINNGTRTKCSNTSISATYAGWIDLFGWGTSGYNNKYPYMHDGSNYPSRYGDGTNDITGTNYDWGIYNEIYNPKTGTTDPAGTWRTLTKEEWTYLFSTRTRNGHTGDGYSYKCTRLTLQDGSSIFGALLLPDDFFGTVSNTTSWNTWETLESLGAVFLPAAGYRGGESGTSVSEVNAHGYYYSITKYTDNSQAYSFYFSSTDLYTLTYYHRYRGYSIRLAKNAN